jgi:hypothetical protein
VIDLLQGAFGAADEIMTGLLILVGIVGVAMCAAFLGWLLFQFVKACTRNLVRGGADR